ncbi:hypothetical protein LCGC14_3057420 [marine sediment metagenome]|uniref:Uncharacterized protein n=1 Tax=marine sediment metagenome TaxID=412755 RepID=A0A0F8YSQ1_9ZZZZ
MEPCRHQNIAHCESTYQCLTCGVKGEEIRALWERNEQPPELDLVSTLEAVGLHVETDCPMHPDADHAPFECP